LTWKPISGLGGAGGGSKRAELLVNVAEASVVDEQALINLGQAFEDGGIGGKVLAHFDKGADDIDAHGHSAGAVENIGGHQGAVFRESVGGITASAAPDL
jgi:hypothetical protein